MKHIAPEVRVIVKDDSGKQERVFKFKQSVSHVLTDVEYDEALDQVLGEAVDWLSSFLPTWYDPQDELPEELFIGGTDADLEEGE